MSHSSFDHFLKQNGSKHTHKHTHTLLNKTHNWNLFCQTVFYYNGTHFNSQYYKRPVSTGTHARWLIALHAPLPSFSPLKSAPCTVQYSFSQLLYMKMLWNCLWLSPLVCKVWVGKGRLHHYAFKERSLCALHTNQGAVIDEDPELRWNQRLHFLSTVQTGRNQRITVLTAPFLSVERERHL